MIYDRINKIIPFFLCRCIDSRKKSLHNNNLAFFSFCFAHSQLKVTSNKHKKKLLVYHKSVVGNLFLYFFHRPFMFLCVWEGKRSGEEIVLLCHFLIISSIFSSPFVHSLMFFCCASAKNMKNIIFYFLFTVFVIVCENKNISRLIKTS